MKFGYYGYIPSYIRHNQELSPMAKLVYAEITANIEQDGYCIKNNSYFMRVLNISRATISRIITTLRESNLLYVVIEQEEKTNKFIKRYIALTLPQIRVGVNNQIDIPHAQKRDRGNALEGDLVPNTSNESDQKRGTLLYNNNDIHYIYSNHKKDTPINKSITENQLLYLKKIVNNFYSTQNKNYPEIIKSDWFKDSVLVNGSINVLFDLLTIDKWDEDKVRGVIDWVVKDTFWASKCYSLRVLRDKAPNGQAKFTNMYASYIDKGGK